MQFGKVYRGFRGACCLHHQSDIQASSDLLTDTAQFPANLHSNTLYTYFEINYIHAYILLDVIEKITRNITLLLTG
jgi:hypothetical protein